MRLATEAIETHQAWLEGTVQPAAKADFRIGRERFDKKLAFALHSTRTRAEIREAAEQRVDRLHQRMYEIAKPLYREQYPLTRFPRDPSREYRRSIIRFALELAYAEKPPAHAIVETARSSLADITDFIRTKDLITLTQDPVEIIVMPEFQRGVSLAYCDSPGPLDKDLKTFYAVSPIPRGWTKKQIESHLREYNTRSLNVLTIHEAMPGHFVQLAHSNRYPGTLRHLFGSGVFVEGWAGYTEWMLCEEGFLDHDPLQELVTLKW